jgi:hypothetical protein
VASLDDPRSARTCNACGFARGVRSIRIIPAPSARRIPLRLDLCGDHFDRFIILTDGIMRGNPEAIAALTYPAT